ncbi:MAG: DUF2236 domain-containing protein [Roseivirga sp. XM-24bin3]|nr:MAG: DUF2236 domain-containing protein [Roseivirga sp. XM-24bin3]
MKFDDFQTFNISSGFQRVSSLTHISKRGLKKFRQQTDPLADAVISKYFPSNKVGLQQELALIVNNESELLNSADLTLVALYTDIWSKSDKLSESDLKLGQQFFNKHASDIMLLLGMLSLPYCYAAANGAEVLVRSKRILEEPEKRLLETAEFVFNVCSRNAFSAKGRALSDILKIRLMHAAARWYALHTTEWNASELGQPVNQEDMAGTNLSFSLIVIRGLKKLGKSVSVEEAFGYINYWNLIGDLLGVNQALLPKSNREAYILERNIREGQFRQSESGLRLTKSLLRYFETATLDTPLKGRSKTLVAYLLGDRVSGLLGLQNSLDEKVLFQPYKYFFKIQNTINLRNDSYAAALKQFREVQKSVI